MKNSALTVGWVALATAGLLGCGDGGGMPAAKHAAAIERAPGVEAQDASVQAQASADAEPMKVAAVAAAEPIPAETPVAGEPLAPPQIPPTGTVPPTGSAGQVADTPVKGDPKASAGAVATPSAGGPAKAPTTPGKKATEAPTSGQPGTEAVDPNRGEPTQTKPAAGSAAQPSSTTQAATPSPAPVAAAPEPEPVDPIQLLVGKYRVSNAGKAKQTITDAIEAVVADMSFVTRGIARKRLTKSNRLPSTMSVAVTGKSVTVGFDGRRYTGTLGGPPIPAVGPDKGVVMFSCSMRNDVLHLKFAKDDGGKRYALRLSKTGNLSIKVSVYSGSLPRDVVYRLGYRKA